MWNLNNNNLTASQRNKETKKQRNKQTTQHRYCHHQDKTSFTTVCNQQAASKHVIRLRCIEQRRTEIIVHCIDICSVGKQQFKYVRSVGQTRRQVKSAAETQRNRSPFITTWSDFSDLVFLTLLIKKPMILCARSTSRSREQSSKHKSSTGNMWKFCSFYDQTNKSLRLSNMADIFLEKFTRRAKFFFFLFLDCAFRPALIG